MIDEYVQIALKVYRQLHTINCIQRRIFLSPLLCYLDQDIPGESFPTLSPLNGSFITNKLIILDLLNTKKYRNFNLLSIGYVKRPHLRTDLPDPD